MILSIFFLFILIILLLTIYFIILLGNILINYYTGVPYAPTPHSTIKTILRILQIKKGVKLYDLGCGDGRFLFSAEKMGAEVIGFEISPFSYIRTLAKKIFTKSNAKIYFKNFFYQNLSSADIVFCFLVDSVMNRVSKKLQNELKPGTKIVSYGFPLLEWSEDPILQQYKKNDPSLRNIYFYTK